jgi:hypothetical protein
MTQGISQMRAVQLRCIKFTFSGMLAVQWSAYLNRFVRLSVCV